MPRTRSDTRAEIRNVAAELFATQGFGKTSLREVAEQLGITKAALYYHFPSKTDLLHGIVQPLVDEVEDMLDYAEKAQPVAPRLLLQGFFDVTYRHRDVYRVILRDLSVVNQLGLVSQVLDWRKRMNTLLLGEDATLAQWARATVAVGGLQDCLLSDAPVEEFRSAALDAACAALGVDKRRGRADQFG